MRWICIIIFINIFIDGYSQKNDYVWIIGDALTNTIFNGYQWGTAIADFKADPVVFKYDNNITMDMSGTNGIVSDAEGQLIMYSNGMYVHNASHEDVPGLDTISYSPHWENFNYHSYLPDGSDWKSGLSGNQWVLMLPDPANANVYYVFHPYVEITKGPLYLANLFETKVLFDQESQSGKVIYKEKKVSSGNFQWGLTAVRHANGRDWWLVHGTILNKSIDIYNLDKNGLHLSHKEDNIFKSNHRRSFHQASFSPRGDKYVIAEALDLTDTIRISIYDFDRCSGSLAKEESKILTKRNFTYAVLSFSPDGRYLYYTDGFTMYQCDMDASDVFATEMIVAEYDGSISDYYREKLTFSKMGLGPDGRIYCIPPGNTRSIHTIEYPEEGGEACTMIQNKIALPIKNFNSIPNVPHYRLGPEDGSPCDTLGIDNMPVAHFRYEQDTSDHFRLRFTDLSYFRPERWDWDFGDGTTFSGRKPYYHTFPGPGKYSVCLTVSNENNSHTFCRDIILGDPTSAIDVQHVKINVHLFPNPTDGDLNITLSDYIPADASVLIYDMMGTLVVENRIYYGQNNIGFADIKEGIYIYKITENGKEVWTGKIVKIGR
jgi:hypothetical protein